MTSNRTNEDRRCRQRAVEAFERRFGEAPTVVVRAPGRVNLIGGHVDYSGGLVLPACIDRALWLVAGKRSDGRVVAEFVELGERGDFSLDAIPPPVGQRDDQARPIDYVAGTACALRADNRVLPGLSLAVASDVPIGAGVSSSAALEVALLLAWERLGNFELSGLERALLGRSCENQYVGVGSGIMDQYAIAEGKEQTALLLDCRSREHVDVALPGDFRAIVVDSGVRRRLAVSGFNDRRSECEEAARLLAAEHRDFRSLRDLSVGDLEQTTASLPLRLRRRVKHVVSECDRVIRCARALANGDRDECRATIFGSHQSSRDNYQVSIAELDVLAESAMSEPSCWGARLSGGGFGGCVVAVARSQDCPAVIDTIVGGFDRRFGREPSFFVSSFTGGARYVARGAGALATEQRFRGA